MSSNKTLTDKARFDFIRYANVWEDASVLRKALQIQAGEKVLSIASGGDNCFYLLIDAPSLVVAVDLSGAQLYLVELKKQAIKHLGYEDVLALLGFRVSEQRLELFNRISRHLSEEAQQYWKERSDIIESGLIHDGKFEKYFQTFSSKVLPFIHSKKKTLALLQPKSDTAQKAFFDQHWNTWRWRTLFKIFFSKRLMGWLGRDPAFLKQVEINVSEFILSQAERQLSSTRAHNNHMLRYNLTGDFGELLPEYLRPENFKTIKENIDVLQCFKGYAQEAAAKFGSFDAFNLSNIFEYISSDDFSSVGKSFVDIANPNARFAYWNLMVPRKLSALFRELEFQKDLCAELMENDKGFYYSQFVLEKLKA